MIISMFSEDFIETLCQTVDIIPLIQPYVALKQQGSRWVGLCPFHAEKTPSFTVSREKGFFYCFGCQQKGNVIDFVRQYHHMNFRDAVIQLAESHGMVVPQKEDIVDHRRLYDINASLAQWFHENLLRHTQALAYLAHRGFNRQNIKDFQLGWAPDTYDLTKITSGPKDTLKDLGLLTSWQRPFFRNRIIFPIVHKKQKVLGFGGRLIQKSETWPKYLNSPESPVFHKKYILYGESFPSFGGNVVCVEGYFDVLRLHAMKVAQGVAPLGTALTVEHCQKLWSLSLDPILCFDGDKAGQAAKDRTLILALKLLQPGKEIKVCTMPTGEDPDALGKNHPDLLNHCLKQSQSLSEALWHTLQYKVNSALPSAEKALFLKHQCNTLLQHATHPDVKKSFRWFFEGKIYALLRDKKNTSTLPVGGPLMPLGTSKIQNLQGEMILSVFTVHGGNLEEFLEDIVHLSFHKPFLSQWRDEWVTWFLEALRDGIDQKKNFLHSAPQWAQYVEKVQPWAPFIRENTPLPQVVNNLKSLLHCYRQYDDGKPPFSVTWESWDRLKKWRETRLQSIEVEKE